MEIHKSRHLVNLLRPLDPDHVSGLRGLRLDDGLAGGGPDRAVAQQLLESLGRYLDRLALRILKRSFRLKFRP
jgi:hypothetical protein